ncbi:hypothetical protein [Tenacibaculum dicentrarchi]
MIFFILTTISSAQNNTITSKTGKKYMFSESCSHSHYASSFVFKKNKKEEITSVLNKYFDRKIVSGSVIIWNKLKNDEVDEDILFIEIKNKGLKIEWKSQTKTSNDIINQLKKISTEIIEILK